MPSWWLWAVLYSSLAQAWIPPPKPLLLQPRMLSSRQRRQSSLPQRHVLELNGWVAELTENTAFRVPHQDECQFYTGHVLGEPESYVALTECAGQHYGLIHVGDKEYTLQPTDNSDKDHILRRREAISDDVSPKVASYNLTGDTINDLELDFNDYEDDMEIPVHRPMKADNNEKEYFRDVNIISRPLKGVNGLWLEMAVVADYTVVQFHGKARVRHYILALMNIVSAIFNDPSLNANMTLVINKLFLQEDSDTVIRPGNAKKSLEAVNKWNYRHLMKLPPESSGWDAAVWVTRADLGGPSGFAPVGGICARTRSAALDRDEGLTSAFVIAHELAHLLGLTHDGDGDCDADARRGSVMASTVLATLHKYAWSTCSKKHFHQKSKSWYCMHRRSKDTGISLGGATELKNYVFTMDEQCRTEFGEGFSVCDSVRVSSPCSRLWCAHRALPQVCRTKRAPPLDGTPCALDHWCVSGFCEPISRQLSSGVAEAPRAGGWGVWHEWSDCGATCGYGLRARTRACDNPPPAGDGAHCAGAASEAQVCWAGRACVAATGRDIRADLCHRRSPAFIPYPHRNDSEWCSTWCVDGAGGEPINLGSLPDGTPCDYIHAHNLCYQGSCVPGRCNESDSTYSWCLDGFCNNNTLVYSRTLRRGWTRLAIIPHEARQLEVRMATPIALRFALKERGKPALELSKHQTKLGATYLRTDADVPMNLQVVQALPDEMNTPQEEYQGRIVSAGALLTWAQSDFEVLMRSDGALQADLMILAAREQRVAVEDGHQVQVFVNYSTPARRPQPYRWETERSACSVSCGGGVRWTRARCHPAHRCPPAARAPPVRYEPCNMHRCEWRWSAGEWEPCSASCGDQGLQERMVYCVPSSARITNAAELVNALVSPVVCTEPPLPRQQPCNRIPCPVYWRELSWTPCSTSCGRGFSYRPLECPSPEAAACGPRPPERRRRCRVRRCPPASDCRAPDASNYCVLQQLSRACLLPPFRKICCNACREHEVANPRS